MILTSLWICLLIVAIAVATDVFTRQMPNLVTLGGLACGIIIHAAIGFVDAGVAGGARGIGVSVLGALACGIIPFLGWKRGELGGGDVKLLAAIGALLGPTVGFDVVTRTFALAFILLFPYRLIRSGAGRAVFANASIFVRNLIRRHDARLPYAESPKLPPVILGPTIGLAVLLTAVQQGALR